MISLPSSLNEKTKEVYHGAGNSEELDTLLKTCQSSFVGWEIHFVHYGSSPERVSLITNTVHHLVIVQ